MPQLNLLTRNKYLIILCVSFLTVGFCLGSFSSDSSKNISTEKVKDPPTPFNDNRTFFWEIYPELVIPSTGRKINNSISLLDLNDKVITLQSISKDFPLLVFRYSKFDCNVCVDQVFEKLTKQFEGKEKSVCILLDGFSAREARMKYRDKGLKFPIYILHNNKLGLTLENKNLPFMFVLENTELEVNKIFVPFKEHSHQTDIYLKQINTYLN